MTWSEPSATNGPLLKYITTVNSRTFEGMSTRLTVSGLEEAVQYTVKVRAVNKFGGGPNTVLSVRTRDSGEVVDSLCLLSVDVFMLICNGIASYTYVLCALMQLPVDQLVTSE